MSRLNFTSNRTDAVDAHAEITLVVSQRNGYGNVDFIRRPAELTEEQMLVLVGIFTAQLEQMAKELGPFRPAVIPENEIKP